VNSSSVGEYFLALMINELLVGPPEDKDNTKAVDAMATEAEAYVENHENELPGEQLDRDTEDLFLAFTLQEALVLLPEDRELGRGVDALAAEVAKRRPDPLELWWARDGVYRPLKRMVRSGRAGVLGALLLEWLDDRGFAQRVIC
jgi:hypothetical protein